VSDPQPLQAFALPDLGEGLHEAEIIEWHVAAGEEVVAGQPLLSVETDKAQADVASPRAGRVARLLVQVGERVPTGTVLLEFEDGESEDAGTVVGVLPAAQPRAMEPGVPLRESSPRIRAAPAVRALAERLGVDLASVEATGPGGAVTSADIERAAADATGGFETLRGVRLAMLRNMERARREVVPAGIVDEADVDTWSDQADVTLRLIRAIAAGCRAEPVLNAWLDARAPSRRLHPQIDLAIAMDTREGLFAPVLRNVHERSPSELRREIEVLEERVASRTLTHAELEGATFTLSNFGTLGGRYAQLVVVPPQVAILGAGCIRPRVVAGESGPAVRRTLPLSLSFDHRAVTGGEAMRFLSAAIADLERAT
jgi:pyruvate dehydrogenase E2 component (dihydrolipoamide acetyltransferase)